MNLMTCKKLALSSAAAFVFALTGCGGGSNTTAITDTLSGIAAAGAPIVSGTVNIQCAAGNAIASTMTSTVGAFQFNLTGQTLPCAVQVSGGTVNGVTNATPYHSIAVTVGTVNITPITDLLVANLAVTATPSAWFTALGTSKMSLTTINQTATDASIAKLRSTLAALSPLATLNPVTSAFTAAAGNSMDDILTAFNAAMTKAFVGYNTLLTAAATPDFTAPVGFSAALGNTFAATVSGGSMVVPAAPEGLAASATSTTDISLSWTAVTGATSYAVYRSTAANVQVTQANKVDTVTTPASTSTGLTVSTAYFYKVTASNAAGESVASAEVSAITNTSAPPPTIIGLSPAAGDVGTAVTLSGTNLGGFTTPAVKFGTTAATITSANATAIVVAVPAGLTAGNTTVTLSNADGTGSVDAGNFTVTVTVTPTPSANALGSGTGFGIVYSGSANTPPAGPNPGIDSRNSVNAQFDTVGNLTAYTFSTDEAPTIGTASVADLATDGTISIGRWTNGTLGGAFYNGTLTFDSNHAFHYVVTKPTLTSALPTLGTVSYQLAAATKPTYLDGHAAPGTLTGSAAVNFETKTVGLDLTLTFPDVTYTLTTAGGVSTPSTSIVTYADPDNFYAGKAFGSGFSFGGLLTGGNCGTGCSVSIRIVFGGAAGERLGVVVQGGTLPMLLHGAAMFNKP